jgi:hypothetical protein
VGLFGRQLPLLLIVLGSFAAISGISVMCVESWAWFMTGTWDFIPTFALLCHITDARPQPVSSSEINHLLFWLFYQPLDRVLVVSGLGVSAVGLLLVLPAGTE